jgi:hypothetical protein
MRRMRHLPSQLQSANVRWSRRLGWNAASALCLTLVFWLGGCGKPGVGDPCKADAECAAVGMGARCLGEKEGFPSGYCSLDCAADAKVCGDGKSCVALAEASPPVCLAGCAKSSDCRDGAQCYEGICQPKCKADTDCRSEGHVCQDGACAERPGKKPGETCGGDNDCQYQACTGGSCALSCQRETACGDGKTCTLDRDASRVRGSCIDRRSAAKTPLVSCLDDSACQQGSCLMGVCLVMCQDARDCKSLGEDYGTPQCVELPAPLRKLSTSKWPRMKGCLPANTALLGTYKASDTLLVPATARSATFVMSAKDQNDSIEVGMQWINNASGQDVYVVPSPADPNGYFKQAIRHQPNLGSSTLLLSGAPQRIQLASAPYPFQAFGLDTMTMLNTDPQVSVVYKLADASPKTKTTGRLPLRIHITDMSGLPSSCNLRALKANNAAMLLQPMVRKLQAIWGQANSGITFDPIDFVDSDAPNSIDANSDTGLGRALQAASKNSGGGSDLVLVRAINPNGVLGIAGGIPSAPGLKNNPRTGAIFATSLICAGVGYTLEDLGQTAAHELGHSFGLSHVIERNGQTDPLGDGMSPSESTKQGKTNLMYWSAEGGESLTTEQGQVLRSMPQVRP